MTWWRRTSPNPQPKPQPSRSARQKSLLVWIVGPATLGVFVGLGVYGLLPLDRLTPLVFDAYQRLHPRAEAGAPVTIVDIDESSMAKLGQWPWPRSTIGQIVDRLGELGAASIAFDMVFPEPDRSSLTQAAADLERAGAKVELPTGGPSLDNDTRLAEAFGRNNVVAGIVVSNETDNPLPAPKAGFSFAGADPHLYLPQNRGGVTDLKPLTDAAAGVGFFSFPPSTDGIVRVLPLISSAQGQLYPTLSLEALRVAQGAKSIIIRSTGASGDADTGVTAMTALRDGDLDVPTGPRGEFWVYFSGLPSMATIPAATLLDPKASAAIADKIAGHIILVGTSAVGLRDLVATPTDASMPGVRVHAEIIDQILGKTFISRPDWARGAEIFAALVLGFILVAIAQRAGAIASAGGAIVLVAVALGGSWAGFVDGQLLLDPILPAGAVLAVFAVTMPLLLLLTDREKQFVRGAFGRYLAPSLVERLSDNPNALKLGGETRELTTLFSDIRGFTSMSEKLEPDALTDLLNSFLTPMTDVLLNSEATIDKYMGDAIMAFWNAPLDIADHRRKSCLAALQMLDALNRLNAERGSQIRIGVGLNTGNACVGNLGSAQRFSYSAIGDSVNLASRVEGLTKSYGVSILTTEATRAGAAELAFLEADLVRVVGRREPVPVHVLLGDAAHAETPEFRALAAAHARLIAAYRAIEVEAAEAALAEATALAPPDFAKFYDLYAERLGEMRQAPPLAGWDGVFTSRQK
ncbi:MAG TPA: adenylate/guanylate cyclase domain-containing protein [Devosiaceae bacterium]|nr:adenylate/guanylate cyclase domain-containing protein [Devosiaceae bacterium]